MRILTNLKCYFALFLCLVVFSLQAENYYVSPNGSNGNPGTNPNQPFQTLQHAHGQSNPGDTIFVMPGTYTVSSGHVLTITRSGTWENPIVYKNFDENERPVLFASKNSNCWSIVKVEMASHIVLDGLEIMGDNDNISLQEGWDVYNHYITNADNNTPIDWNYVSTTNTNGIYVEGEAGNNHHTGPVNVSIRNCLIHHVPAGGISMENFDHGTVENNVSHSNSWYTIYATSGISLFHPFNSGENSSKPYHNVVRNNITYDNETLIPWINPRAISDGNGIIIDDFKNDQLKAIYSGIQTYTGSTLVANNVSYNNGGGGINCFSSVNIDVINNTVYGNSVSPALEYSNIGTGSAENINVINNINYGLNSNDNLTSNNSPNDNVVHSYNILFNGVDRNPGSNIITADPQFVSISNRDFRVQSGSPAINAGTSNLAPSDDILGISRPQGGGYDIGAYEFDDGTPPPDPDPEPDPVPGNLISNGEFNDGLNGWSTGTNSWASATASVVQDAGMSGANALRYSISNGGSANWHVQLNQMQIGSDENQEYTLTFQARTMTNRTITVVLEENGGNWTKYMEQSFNLTSSNQTFTYTFMPSGSDPTANLKFFLGGNNADVWIDAVVLVVEDEDPDPDPDPVSGNLISNGEFNDGLSSWSTHTNSGASATASVVQNAGMSGDNALHYSISNGGSANWNVQLNQMQIGSDANQEYTLSFQARSSSNRSITVVLEENGGNWTKYMEQSFNLTTSNQTFTYTFSPSASDPNANLKFFLGGNNADVWIDAVVLTTDDVGDPEPNLGPNMVSNGEFDNGLSSWWTWVNSSQSASGSVVSDGNLSGNNAFRYTINNGGNAAWQIQLAQSSVDIDASKSYVISFQARASANRSIEVYLEQSSSPHTSYMSQSFNLSAEGQTFSYTFSPSTSDTNANLNFRLGGSNHDVWIDAVSLREVISTHRGDLPEDFLGTIPNSSLAIKVYPNPAHEHFQISFDLEQKSSVQLMLYSLSGRTVLSQAFKDLSEGRQELRLERGGWAPGLYILKFQAGKNQYTEKVSFTDY